jgi:hypothetical protein
MFPGGAMSSESTKSEDVEIDVELKRIEQSAEEIS